MDNAFDDWYGRLAPRVQKFEGFTPRTWDYKQHSIGYGTRWRPGMPTSLTREKAEVELRRELTNARAIVDRHAPHAPTGVKDALTSLTFNAGDQWASSGLGDAIRRGDYAGAKERFVQYNKAGGAVLPGLVSRRNEEAQWFDGKPVDGASVPQDQNIASVGSTTPANAASVGGANSQNAFMERDDEMIRNHFDYKLKTSQPFRLAWGGGWDLGS